MMKALKLSLLALCLACTTAMAHPGKGPKHCPAPPACPSVEAPDLSVVVAACQTAAEAASTCALTCADVECPETPACPACPVVECPAAPACPDVQVQTTILTCKKVRTLKDGTQKAKGCKVIVEPVSDGVQSTTEPYTTPCARKDRWGKCCYLPWKPCIQ